MFTIIVNLKIRHNQINLAKHFGSSQNKQWTLSRWNTGLNKNLQTYIDSSLNGDKLDVNPSIQLQRRREMVKYAVNDCLA
ncbi:unnamed protein product [Didymodactylos carnosus]|uniref:Uncharacterized protein n=1 Tax=Didymodactylos carnosus TaxID=1234261 RepID=A0A8S2D6X3_9BILA|nr:unnamed protein product [Didymodactylos carnosus]CAF3637584.1 unnamed protein product [Didymodactylos carnosus]